MRRVLNLATTKDVMETIAALEQEFGVSSYEAPEGTHHIRFGENTGVTDGEMPRLRMEMEIICGPHKGQRLNNFQGYFASTGGNRAKPLEERRTGARSYLIRTLGSLARGIDSNQDLLEAWRKLPQENNESDPNIVRQADTAMAEIGDALQDVDVYVTVKNTENGPNFRYVRQGDKQATCECTLQSHNLDFLNGKG